LPIPILTLHSAGKNSGLGALLSTTFASHGCNIAINYFNRAEPARSVADACSALGVRAVLVQADMTDTSEARRAVREAREALGGLDLVVANAVCFSFCLESV
jgi:NAD(P)-dependent dehydrogenase (short-subunit alcohol dehydrogenase family)